VEPRFHGLHHQMDLIVGSFLRARPLVAWA
jgi:hypothetical protein